MQTPISKVLKILRRELELSKSIESKAILSATIVEIESNLIAYETQIMSDVFDSGFSLGADSVLNDKPNISGNEWIANRVNDKKIICEICDSEIIPECEYSDCPNRG